MRPLTVSLHSSSTPFPLVLQAEIDTVLRDHPEALAECGVVDGRVLLRADTERSLEQAFLLLKPRIPELESGALEVKYLSEPNAQEPYYRVDVRVPHDSWGDVIADLNRRHGTIEVVRDSDEVVLVGASAPVIEMLGYDSALRILTLGRASVEYEFIGFKPMRPTDPSFPTAAASRRVS